ncbi:MAG: isopentenyl phosphate kinase family protein [Caldilineaceae bacterium]|nr:isopentenyl phosphate kinase family protein [Caldilineaceae bacterium]
MAQAQPENSPTGPVPTRYLLKLGGSLITDKRQPETARTAVMRRLAQEIAAARSRQPQLELVIGHGSGSFGHVVGKRYGTRAGVATPEQWFGFAATADAAARLNRLLIAALLEAGVPAWTIQPGAFMQCADGEIVRGSADMVQTALARGLTPVVHGDVMLDSIRGGTIASTEEVFARLARQLQPQRVILLGEVDGIFTADPQLEPQAQRIAAISPATFDAMRASLGGSHGVDVTGGMSAKVAQAMGMLHANPGLEIIVCSGLIENNLLAALTEPPGSVGTRLYG